MFTKELKGKVKDVECVIDSTQKTLFDMLELKKPTYILNSQKIEKTHFQPNQPLKGLFRLQNRRYLGNKHKLLGFIEDVIFARCQPVNSICDVFAGTGVVGERINNRKIKVISNDFLYSNYVCLQTFLGVDCDVKKDISEKIMHLNNLPSDEDNYFSKHFGGMYYTRENARKIGAIRQEIEKITDGEIERNILICALLYAADKVANTVGHYDAFRKKLDTLKPVKLLLPDIDYSCNVNNEIYQEDANALITKISCDVLYIDPPYNSRQYSDAYHLLENLAEWKKPDVVGVGKKMDRSHIKSNYCLKSAVRSFTELIGNADCKNILLSYNNTGNSKDDRSNAKMSDDEIFEILNARGATSIFEKPYKAFTTGRSNGENSKERIFYCKVTN